MTQLVFDRQALKKGLQQALEPYAEFADSQGLVIVDAQVDLDDLVDQLIEALKGPRLVGEESERREGGVPGLEKDD